VAVMSIFGPEHQVVAFWDGREVKRQQVSGKGEARSLAVHWLLSGYAVAFTNALIGAMGRSGPGGAVEFPAQEPAGRGSGGLGARDDD
jgi:hypothetical protein